MKVRVCPKCGKHNLENAWNCMECGETLSIKTVMETETGQLLNVTPIAGQTALSEISTHFEQDVVKTLRTSIRVDESILWGCNFAKLSRTPPFIFGYLIITSRQMVCVQFDSDIQRDKPRSAVQVLLNPINFFIKESFGVYEGSAHPWSETLPQIPYPSKPLTPTEINSRQAMTHDLRELVSLRSTTDWVGDVQLKNLVFSFRKGDAFTITLYSTHQAEKTCQVLGISK